MRYNRIHVRGEYALLRLDQTNGRIFNFSTGIFKKEVHTNILTHVLSVTVKQSFWERVFGYGTITIDVMGQWDIDMSGIKNLKKAKAYLETIAANGMNMSHVLMN